FEVQPGATVPVSVVLNGQTYSVGTVTVKTDIPGIFKLGVTSTDNRAAVLNQDNSINSPTNPASPGQYVVIFATTGGTLSSTLADGQPAPLTGGVINITDPATLTIGGIDAQILFIGLAPGFAGLVQINAVVPAGLTTNSAVPLVLTVGGAGSSAETATIAVAAP